MNDLLIHDLIPRQGQGRWHYDDPSGLPDTPARFQAHPARRRSRPLRRLRELVLGGLRPVTPKEA